MFYSLGFVCDNKKKEVILWGKILGFENLDYQLAIALNMRFRGVLMKIIFSNSILSIIFKILFFLPLLLIIYVIKDYCFSLFYILLIIFFQSSILFLFNALFGVVLLKRDCLYVSGDLFFKVQKRLIVRIEQIIAIEFLTEDCTSDGKKINFRYIGQPCYLKLYLNNGLEERIHLIKFSFKTWKKIEKYLLDNKNDILVIRDATSFKKYLKTGKLEK